MPKPTTLVSVGTAAFVAASFYPGYIAGSNRRTVKNAAAKLDFGAQVTKDSEEQDKRIPESDSESESEDELADISKLPLTSGDDCKMVLVVRTDLGMTSGKIAAQCSHAALACYKAMKAQNPSLLRLWENNGQTKIALRCSDEEELLVMQAQAQSLNLCARSIRDAGRTQIEAGSRTVLGIAGPTRLVNQVTGLLKLL
ncbi:PTH2-domain-containing protein [Cylindrobasidium torrendii FP15055 ss-10]|uniref:peptidyl-tRNA hydrolase n=1 Tax=Cylindrobasidium torrendii FP15055 ss-10 TaxID=1314674 RepID=A0A0D7BJ16_9AGAR|nr:PTH2-domain-containing protein [Cylindrobasidium torrendii FP15055 ss-10]